MKCEQQRVKDQQELIRCCMGRSQAVTKNLESEKNISSIHLMHYRKERAQVKGLKVGGYDMDQAAIHFYRFTAKNFQGVKKATMQRGDP